MQFEGKVAFITGGASGIGLGLARAFIKEKMKVIVADINQEDLEKAVLDLGENSRGVHVDVSDRVAMAKAADEAEALFGKIHVLCNNAGVAVSGHIADMKYQDWDWVLGVNLYGVINGLNCFLPKILSHDEGGYVLNTASMAGYLAHPGAGVYQATKYGVVGMSESLAMEMRATGKNVGVSVLSPAFVDTKIFSSQRNRPEDLCTGPESKATATREDIERIFEENNLPLSRFATIEEVADLTVEAMKEGIFHIFPHPEMKKDLERTMKDVLKDMDWAAKRVQL